MSGGDKRLNPLDRGKPLIATMENEGIAGGLGGLGGLPAADRHAGAAPESRPVLTSPVSPWRAGASPAEVPRVHPVYPESISSSLGARALCSSGPSP